VGAGCPASLPRPRLGIHDADAQPETSSEPILGLSVLGPSRRFAPCAVRLPGRNAADLGPSVAAVTTIGCLGAPWLADGPCARGDRQNHPPGLPSSCLPRWVQCSGNGPSEPVAGSGGRPIEFGHLIPHARRRLMSPSPRRGGRTAPGPRPAAAVAGAGRLTPRSPPVSPAARVTSCSCATVAANRLGRRLRQRLRSPNASGHRRLAVALAQARIGGHPKFA
jgi:hypothetical protein